VGERGPVETTERGRTKSDKGAFGFFGVAWVEDLNLKQGKRQKKSGKKSVGKDTTKGKLNSSKTNATEKGGGGTKKRVKKGSTKKIPNMNLPRPNEPRGPPSIGTPKAINPIGYEPRKKGGMAQSGSPKPGKKQEQKKTSAKRGDETLDWWEGADTGARVIKAPKKEVLNTRKRGKAQPKFGESSRKNSSSGWGQERTISCCGTP